MTDKTLIQKNKLLEKLDNFLQKNIELLVQALGWLAILALLLGIALFFKFSPVF